MSSAYESRDSPNGGNEPTVPLGYPAVVRYSFTPQTTEFNELVVSEGDIVQLLYRVGGWVFVKTYTGQTGYIPIQYCLTLDSSKRLSALYDDVGSDANLVTDAGDLNKQPEDVPGHFFKTLGRSELYGKLTSDKEIHNVSGLEKKPPTYTVHNTNGRVKQSGQFSLNCDQIADKPPTFPPGFDPKLKQNTFGSLLSDNYLNGRTISESTVSGSYCRFLSQIVLALQNLAITDREKADLKSRKLIKILKLASKESSNLSSVIRPAIEREKIYNAKITNANRNIKCIVGGKGEFESQCPYCNILKEYFKDSGEIPMSDLYSTIRNLHLHALSDSDSENESNQNQDESKQKVHAKQCLENGNDVSSQTNGSLNWATKDHKSLPDKRNGEQGMKRSVSFQLQEKHNSKSELTRNRSFSGRTFSEMESESNQFQFNGNHIIMNGFGNECSSKHPTVPPAYDQVFITECAHSPKTETNNNSKMQPYEANSQKSLTNGDDSNVSERLSNHDPLFSRVHDTSYGSIHSDSSSKSGSEISPKHNKLAESALSLLNSQARIYERTKQSVNDGNMSSTSNSSESINVQKPKDVIQEKTFDHRHNYDTKQTMELMSTAPVKSENNAYYNFSELRPNHDAKSVSNNVNLNRDSSSVKEYRSNHDRQSSPEHRSHHNREPAMVSQVPHNRDVRPKQFQQLNFYGLASLSGSASLSHTDNNFVKEPPMPSESAKYNTWGGKMDKKKIIARRLQIPGSPRDNGPLSPRPDDKDIRKSLQGLSSVKKTMGPVKAQPMRAEHSIQVQNTDSTDKVAAQRTVLVKKFNKKMWRAPSGVPEGCDQRPFSPFGGTLPPSKIVKKKVVEVFV